MVGHFRHIYCSNISRRNSNTNKDLAVLILARKILTFTSAFPKRLMYSKCMMGISLLK